MNLSILPLSDFHVLREQDMMSDFLPGAYEKLMSDPQLKSRLEDHAANREREDRQRLEQDPCATIDLTWPGFYAQGRYAPEQRWFIAWGKVGDGDYRVALLVNGELSLWVEASDRIVDAWVADNGFFVVKSHLNAELSSFTFCQQSGHVFLEWQHEWRFFKFLGIDADGMGFSYQESDELIEVSFDPGA